MLSSMKTIETGSPDTMELLSINRLLFKNTCEGTVSISNPGKTTVVNVSDLLTYFSQHKPLHHILKKNHHMNNHLLPSYDISCSLSEIPGTAWS